MRRKKKKRNFSRIFYSQTLHIWTTCFTHLTVFRMLICFVLWTTKCRIGDDTNTTTKAVSWGKNHHFFLHLRQALLSPSLKRPFQFTFPLFSQWDGAQRRSRKQVAMNIKVCYGKKIRTTISSLGPMRSKILFICEQGLLLGQISTH